MVRFFFSFCQYRGRTATIAIPCAPTEKMALRIASLSPVSVRGVSLEEAQCHHHPSSRCRSGILGRSGLCLRRYRYLRISGSWRGNHHVEKLCLSGGRQAVRAYCIRSSFSGTDAVAPIWPVAINVDSSVFDCGTNIVADGSRVRLGPFGCCR